MSPSRSRSTYQGWMETGWVSNAENPPSEKKLESAPFFPPLLPLLPQAGHCICLISGTSFEGFTGILRFSSTAAADGYNWDGEEVLSSSLSSPITYLFF